MGDYSPVTTADAVSAYLLELANAGRSPRTTAAYAHHLGPLVDCVPQLPCSADDIRRALVNRQQSQNSRGQQLRAIRRFLKWADVRYDLGGNPADDVMDIKAQTEPPRVFSDAEVDRIVATTATARDRLMVLLMLDSGIRVGELAALQPTDIEGEWLIVSGKTGPRRVPISGWIAEEVLLLAEDGVFWRGRGRRSMTVEAIKKNYLAIFRAAGIEGRRLGPHTLRHTFASRWVENGGDVAALQVIMGHATIEQTMAYVSLAGSHALRQHAAHALSRRYAPDRSAAAIVGTAGTRTIIDEPVNLAPTFNQPDPDFIAREIPAPDDDDEDVDVLLSGIWRAGHEAGWNAGYERAIEEMKRRLTELGDDSESGWIDPGMVAVLSLNAISHVLERLDRLEGR